MEDNRNTGNQRPTGENRYVPNSNLSAEERRAEYYRRLSEQQNSGRPENYRPAHMTEQTFEYSINNPAEAHNHSSSSGHHSSSSGGHSSSHHHHHHHHHRRRRRSKAKKIIISILAIFLVIVLAVCGTGYYYLNLIDFDDGKQLTYAPVDPDAQNTGDEGGGKNGSSDGKSGKNDNNNDSDPLNEGDILNEDTANLSDEEKESISKANKEINANLDNNQIWTSESVTNILLMGIDYGSYKFPYGRSDSMIVVSINNVSKKVKLVSLSRAVYSAIPGYNNTRLSHAHGYGGPELAIKSIENNYKIKIDNYASVTFQGFKNIINALGGVTIDLESAEARALSYYLGSSSAGTYLLNGEQALAYARQRKIDTDRARTGRQRKILESLANKAKKMSIPQMMSAMDDVLPNVRTDMTRTQLIGMLSKALTYLNYSIEETVIPHESSGLVLRGGFEVLIVDWKTEIPYVHDLFYGDVQAKTVQ